MRVKDIQPGKAYQRVQGNYDDITGYGTQVVVVGTPGSYRPTGHFSGRNDGVTIMNLDPSGYPIRFYGEDDALMPGSAALWIVKSSEIKRTWEDELQAQRDLSKVRREARDRRQELLRKAGEAAARFKETEKERKRQAHLMAVSLSKDAMMYKISRGVEFYAVKAGGDVVASQTRDELYNKVYAALLQGE